MRHTTVARPFEEFVLFFLHLQSAVPQHADGQTDSHTISLSLSACLSVRLPACLPACLFVSPPLRATTALGWRVLAPSAA